MGEKGGYLVGNRVPGRVHPLGKRLAQRFLDGGIGGVAGEIAHLVGIGFGVVEFDLGARRLEDVGLDGGQGIGRIPGGAECLKGRRFRRVGRSLTTARNLLLAERP